VDNKPAWGTSEGPGNITIPIDSNGHDDSGLTGI
jgi:hypothetical protein